MIEALKLALEFIERVNKDGWILADFEPQMYATITAIKEALAQTQEPVAWYYPDGSPDQCTTNKVYAEMEPAWIPLYTTPPQRTWVGLTADEQSFVFDQVKQIVDSKPFWVRFADAIEAKLKEKNA